MSGPVRHAARAFVLVAVGILVGFVANPEGLRRPTRSNARSESAPLPAITRISVEEAFRDYEDGGAIFLDARERPHFEAGHLPGAIALVGEDAAALLPRVRSWLSRRDRIIVYAGAAPDVRSALRVNELRAAGFAHAVVLDGGFPAWTQRGHPVDRGWDMEPLLEEGERR